MVFGPPFGGKDFDFTKPIEAGFGHELIDMIEADAAFAHDAAIEEEVFLVGFEIADVVSV